MITPELETYLRQQLGAGVAKDTIKQSLSAQGWVEQDINDAFSAIESAQPQPPVAPPPSAQSPVQTPVENSVQPVVAASHKGVWATVIILLIFLGAGGAYAAYQYDLVAVFIPTPVVSPVATTTESAIPFVTDTESASTTSLFDDSTWKVFRNETYGYEIKYPTDFELDADYYGGVKITDNLESHNWMTIRTLKDQKNVVIDLAIEDQPNIRDLEIEDVATFKMQIAGLFEKETETSLLGQSYQKTEGNINGNSSIVFTNLKYLGSKSAFIYLNKKVFELDINPLAAKTFTEKDERIFDQILSTFKSN